MKINGRVVQGAYTDFIVIPRGEESLIIKAAAVLDETPFDKLCPFPTPPKIHKAGADKPIENVEDPGYIAEKNAWIEKKSNWLNIQSLRATDGLEWDRVEYSDPGTWHLWIDDLQNAGLALGEIVAIRQLIDRVNAFDQSKLDEAKARFLLTQRVEKKE